MNIFERVATLHDKLAQSHPKLQRGMVWCRTCGRSEKVDSAECLRTGWPKCCGHTMTIDAPTEA
jgi:Zn finger protein HypA/HybF involved in hydrogenase expression